jgi:hypothetical protein
MIRPLLEGGDWRSLGRSHEAVGLIAEQPALFGALLECLWDEDPVVRMRAADAAEKASLGNPQLLQPHKKELLGLADEAVQQELRWHLAIMIPRLRLSTKERKRAHDALCIYLEDKSSIVKTLAMQGLADLAEQDARLKPGTVEQIRTLTRTGTPAMRARGRKLLVRLER